VQGEVVPMRGEQRLAGRTAIVTGAGQGIGLGVAAAMADEGANVVLAARRAETGEPAAQSIRDRGGEAVCIVTDVAKPEQLTACVEETVQRFGSLEIVVHNAIGGGKGAMPHQVADCTLDHWKLYDRTAVLATFALARDAHPHLKAAGTNGRMILLVSPAGMVGSDSLPLYAAVKEAQRSFLKTLAREWGVDGITVNGIAPVAETPALEMGFEYDAKLRGRLEAATLLGRLGHPEDDIGRIAVFLASDDASYITGQSLVCDGGGYLGL
jgi:NAD(P)-dependent dehydrogenase (short-subunit alcohol dehydrogenase family)